MIQRLKHILLDENGQGMTEYVLMVTLIGIALIVATKFFGREIANLFSRSADSLAAVDLFSK